VQSAATEPTPDHPATRTAWRSDARTVVAVCPAPLWPQSNGYALRVGNLLGELTKSWRVVLVAQASPADQDRTAELDLAELVPIDLGSGIATMPWQLDTAPLRKVALDVIRRVHPRAVLLWSGAEFLAFEADLPFTVADRIDCATLSNWRHARARSHWIDRYRAIRAATRAAWYERRVVRTVGATVVVGDTDASVLRRISGRESVYVVPNGVTLPPLVAKDPESPTPTVIFTGVMSFEPNIAAVRFFADAIWPAVRQAVPDARFVVAGRAPAAVVRRLGDRPGIEIRPDVEAMEHVLRDAWVAIAPMRSGTGIKNKVLEAWSCERPVVMSTLATNGLTLDDSTRSLVADDPAEFAAHVVRLLGDGGERRRLGQAGYALAAASHTWAQSADAISQLLEGNAQLASRPGP
jgi:glycosyltransferase involved in cell wall biosynthesis